MSRPIKPSFQCVKIGLIAGSTLLGLQNSTAMEEATQPWTKACPRDFTLTDVMAKDLSQGNTIKMGGFSIKLSQHKEANQGNYQFDALKSPPEPLTSNVYLCKYKSTDDNNLLTVTATPIPTGFRPSQSLCPDERLIGAKLKKIAKKNAQGELIIELGEEFDKEYVIGLPTRANRRESLDDEDTDAVIKSPVPWKLEPSEDGICHYRIELNMQHHHPEMILPLVPRNQFERYFQDVKRTGIHQDYIKKGPQTVEKIKQETRQEQTEKIVTTHKAMGVISKRLPDDVRQHIKDDLGQLYKKQ